MTASMPDLPGRVARALRRRQLRRLGYDRERVLERLVHRIRALRRVRALPTWFWTDAVYGFDNERWGSEEPYIARFFREALRTAGPIVECGSGLSTLLLALAAERTGSHVHSLEHKPEWHDRVSAMLRRFALDSHATVHLTPLTSHGDFDWYDVADASLPAGFTLAVCDGPPSATRGGRYGLLPVLRTSLAAGCVVLLDDANRPGEQAVIARWRDEFGAVPELYPQSRGCARLVVPAPPA